jgi:decaprenyl-phosphate phosphoribosyltransferase
MRNNKFLGFIKLARPHHWVKNLFIFIPAFFAQVIFEANIAEILLLGFISFGFITTAVYSINDIRDVEFDRSHPEKRNRPIASGQISKSQAWVFAILCFGIGMSLAFLAGNEFTFICLIYFAVNLAYSLGLKNFSLLDVFLIALGFELRIYGGGFLASVPISPWLSLMIFLLALFLAFAKRRSDLVLAENTDISRKSISSYNLEFLNTTLGILASILILAYIMYTQTNPLESSKSQYQIITSVFVIFGILRYLQRSLVENKGGQPALVFFKDPVVLLCVFGWLAFNFWILY